jgi:RNA polymerase sigma-70 factor (ECF subfamily)
LLKDIVIERGRFLDRVTRPDDTADAAVADGDLVRQALGGQPGAFGLLYERHLPRLHRYLCFRVADAELAMDLVQDVFIQALRSLSQLREPDRFGAWLLSIASRRVAEHWSGPGLRRSGQLPLDGDEDDDRSDAGPVDQAGAAIWTDLEHHVDLTRLIAGSLNDVQAQVLALRFGAGLSLRETAALIGGTEVAARQHQYRALKRLRAVLRDQGERT